MLTKDKMPIALIESKWANSGLSPHFKAFETYFKNIPKIQLVKNLKREKTFLGGYEIRRAENWLAKMPYK